jgi:hypothetical protein
MNLNHAVLFSCLLLLVPLSPLLAAADYYDFEMLIFERPDGGASEFWPDAAETPDTEPTSRRLSDLPAGRSRELGPSATSLKKRGLRILEHANWRQLPGSRNGGTWYAVEAGRLTGRVKVTRGRFLHVHTDLVLRDPASSEQIRITLHRRMRSNELHYLDHPRIGVLIRAMPVATDASEESSESPSGEPKPAVPLG